MQNRISGVAWQLVAMLWICATVLWTGGTVARADCTVETRHANWKSFRVVKCDESAQAIDNAMDRASDSCRSLTQVLDDACYEGVNGAFRLRREAMLRRALKEGATVTAAAELFGYTEEEVEQWIAQNIPTDRGYAEPEEVPDSVLQMEQDMAAIRSLAP